MEGTVLTIPDNQPDIACMQEPTIEKVPARTNTFSQRSHVRSMAIVATCAAANFVVTSNSTSVSIALPVIGKSIDIQEDQLQWLISAYSLGSGCLLLFLGRLADLYGRKRTFIAGMLWQTVFSIGLGFSSNGFTLDILRGLQGLGAAAAIPAALGSLAQSFPPSHARSIAFATFSAGAPIGGAFGAMVGGFVTQLSGVHWRAQFFLSAGLSALCVLGSIISFDPDQISPEEDTRVDWIGAFLVTGGLVLIVLVLGQGAIVGWKTPHIISFLVVGPTLLGMFIGWEHYLETVIDKTRADKTKFFWIAPPVMKLSIWTRSKGRMAVILAIAFLTWCGFMSWMFWVQLFYQNYLGLTPVLTMIRFIPMFVSGFLCNFVVVLVVSRLPLMVFIVWGTLVTGFASVLFALIDPSAVYWVFEFPSTIMIVFGVDFVYASGTLFIANIVLPHEQSLAGGLFQTMTQIGTTFGLTISTIVFNRVVVTEPTKFPVVMNALGTHAPLPVELQGYRSAQWTSAAFSFLAALLALIFLRNVGIVGHREYAEQSALSEQTFTEHQPDGQH